MKVEVASQRPDSTDEAKKAIARLLGRQAAREAFRAARTDSQTTDPAPATTAEEE